MSPPDPLVGGLGAHLDLLLEFSVWGEPQPWRAPNVVQRGPKRVAVTPARVKEYKQGVAMVAIARAGTRWRAPEGPVALSIVIAYHRGRPGAWEPFKITRPDCTNIQKCIEDSLTTRVLGRQILVDDGQVASVITCKTVSRRPDSQTETWVRLYSLHRSHGRATALPGEGAKC